MNLNLLIISDFSEVRLSSVSDPYSLMKTLTELQPRFIVLYDADMEFVRQIEVGSLEYLHDVMWYYAKSTPLQWV